MEKYIPDVYQKSIYTIDYQKLKSCGIKCLLFDLDNTLIPVSAKLPTKKLKEFLKSLKDEGFEVIIFSNNFRIRVRDFATAAAVKYYSNCRKPSVKKFLLAMKENNFDVTEVAMIGDQILTDIRGGNRVGITTILVNPISMKDGILTKLNRLREKRIMHKLHNENLFIQGKYYD